MTTTKYLRSYERTLTSVHTLGGGSIQEIAEASGQTKSQAQPNVYDAVKAGILVAEEGHNSDRAFSWKDDKMTLQRAFAVHAASVSARRKAIKERKAIEKTAEAAKADKAEKGGLCFTSTGLKSNGTYHMGPAEIGVVHHVDTLGAGDQLPLAPVPLPGPSDCSRARLLLEVGKDRRRMSLADAKSLYEDLKEVFDAP